MKQHLHWTSAVLASFAFVACFETPSVSPFPEISDTSVYGGPQSRLDVGGDTSPDTQDLLDTFMTPVADAGEPQGIADSMPPTLDLALRDAVVRFAPSR